MDTRQEQTVTVDHDGSGGADAAFARLLGILNSGMLALMISVGDRTGLFRTMRSMPASTSAEVASAAGSG